MSHDDYLKLIGGEGWSNAACMGYVIHACRTLELPDDEIISLLNALRSAFTNLTVAEAERVYMDY